MPRTTRVREQGLRLFTPRSSFSTTEPGSSRTIILKPGMLVDEGDPIYQRFPEKIREPHVRRYEAAPTSAADAA
jgi:hypothetical protein